jgi:hypothetical protein
MHGRIGLGTACKEYTSRMKYFSIDNSGGKNYVNGLRKIAYTQKNSFIYFIYLTTLSVAQVIWLRMVR